MFLSLFLLICLIYFTFVGRIVAYRNIGTIKQVVRVAVTDADAGARKTARQLYWVLHSAPSLHAHMKALFNDLDGAVQRYITAEAAADSPEMVDLFSILQHPGCLLEHVRRSVSVADAAAMVAEATGSEKGSNLLAGPADDMGGGGVTDQEFEGEVAQASGKQPSSRFAATLGIAHTTSAGFVEANLSTALSSTTRPSATASARTTGGLSSTAQVKATATSSSSNYTNDGCAAVASTPSHPQSNKRLSLAVGGAQRVLSSTTATAHNVAIDSRELPSSSSFENNASSSSMGVALSASAPKSAYLNRRASMGGIRTAAGAAVAAAAAAAAEGGVDGAPTSSAYPPPAAVPAGPSSALLSNGPKRIIRAPPAAATAPAPAPAALLTGATDSTNSSVSLKVEPAALKVMPSALLASHAKELAQAASDIEGREAAAGTGTGTDAGGGVGVGGGGGGDLKVFVFAPEVLRGMAEDAQWSTRVEAFEAINQRLKRAVAAMEALNERTIESFVDMSLLCLPDPHHKVATEAMDVLQTCICSFPVQLKSRLGAIALSLFQRLADRRPAVRDAANEALNLVRASVSPVQVMAALSPRMHEVPDRMKTALMQFLGAIVPHCAEYFAAPQHTWAFLSRMAQIAGAGAGTGAGAKPSGTLTVAARRLLELVYQSAPQVKILSCSGNVFYF
jgi:hypothetical protein